MRLEGNFYKIHNIEHTDGGYKVEVELFESHPIYAGHFPQQAVVPGVCTLTIIRETLSTILSRDVVFEAIKECKYVSALIPQHDLRVILNLTLVDQTKLSAVVERVDNQQTVLKLRATIR